MQGKANADVVVRWPCQWAEHSRHQLGEVPLSLGRFIVQRLAASTGCPTIDAERATYKDIVLRADDDELLVLRYSSYFRLWYACGCMSVKAASNGVIRGADIYWQGVGYLENATFGYAIFEQKPLCQSARWNEFYDRVNATDSLRLLREEA